MKLLFYIIVNLLIVALFLYSKLTPYKANLSGRYRGWFAFCEKIFLPILKLLRKVASPAQVGQGIAVDMSQIVLLIILLIILKII